MTVDELDRKIGEYALNVLAPKAQSWTSKFIIGAGVQAMRRRARALVQSAGLVGADGSVDMSELHEVVMSGFGAAGHVDLMGGVIGFDPKDAEDFFTFAGL